MQNWKKLLVCTTVGAGALLALNRRRNLGLLSASAGLALLASEYPERFESIWVSAPEYISRATLIFGTLSKISENFAEEAERRSVAAYAHPAEEYVE
jgi:hypothetical protein